VNIEATGFTETSVLTRPTRRHTPEDGILHSHRHESCLKSEYILLSFQNSKDPLLSQIYDKMVAPYEESLPVDDIEGIQRLCSTRKYAHATNTFDLFNLGIIPNCTIVALPEAFFPGTIGLAVAQNSPYKEVFNRM
jgi:hypothetical protein